jgi:hypothetical protein
MLLWTTDEWAAWPRSISKAAARVLRDPLLFIAIGGPAYVLLFNTAWPHRVHGTTLKARLVYVAGRAVYLVAYAIGLTCVMQSGASQIAVSCDASVCLQTGGTGITHCHLGSCAALR